MAPRTLKEIYAETNALDKALGLMGWDQQLLMPKGGREARAEHQSRLERFEHELIQSDEMRRALETAEKEAVNEVDLASVRVLRRQVDAATKVPTELVVRKAKLGAESYNQWRVSKPASDFKAMKPYYAEMFAMARERADCLGFTDHPYDALIDEFEEGSTHAAAKRVFDDLKGPLAELINEVTAKPLPNLLHGDWNQEGLRQAGEMMAREIGFRFDAGRLDLAFNAFCMNLSQDDVRMTTRASDHMKGVISSSLHEMGHGLYEQGVDPAYEYTPLASGASHAVHESQSRLWENIIGRSLPFWRHFYPKVQPRFEQLSPLSLNDFYKQMNLVERGPIRVGSDELSYNFHIIIRFELEVEMVTGKITVDDLPEAWNAKYAEYLGVHPKNDGEGVLQDVHWTRGMIGYFPSYAFGNFIGAMVWDKVTGDIPNWSDQFEKGDFKQVLAWLQDKIYRHGHLYEPTVLVKNVTGSDMASGPWLKYAQEKYRGIFV